MTRRRILHTAIAVLAIAAAAHAQQIDPARALRAQLDRVFTDHAYDPPELGPAVWLPDGTAYTVLEKAAGRPDGSEIVRYDAASGARTVLVAASRLMAPGAAPPAAKAPAPFDIDEYAWSNDGRKLLIFTNTKKVWRVNTRGDYWILDAASGALKKLGGGAPESSLMFAKFSPDGTLALRANNIRAPDTGRSSRHAKTDPRRRSADVGLSEEELDLRDVPLSRRTRIMLAVRLDRRRRSRSSTTSALRR